MSIAKETKQEIKASKKIRHTKRKLKNVLEYIAKKRKKNN